MRKSIFRVTFIVGLILCAIFHSFGQTALQDENNYIDVDGAKLFLRIVGSGEPILIIHGGPGLSHDYLAPQLIDLLANDYQLLFYDQRASGRSTGVEDTARITMTQFIEDIESIRKYFSLSKVNVLGHSFGGLIAMYYASTHPNAIDKVLLIDSTPARWEPFFPMINLAISERETEADKEELAKIRSLRPNIQPSMMEKYFKIYFRPFFTNSQLSEDLSLGVTEQWVSNYMVTYPRIMKNLGKHNILDKLSSIPAPTLIIHGEDSVIAVESAQEIANHIPNCKLTILKGVGHFPYIEAPKEFADAIKAFVK